MNFNISTTTRIPSGAQETNFYEYDDRYSEYYYSGLGIRY